LTAPHDRAGGLSPELRAAMFHFTVFGTTGVAAAYLAIWLSDKGMSSQQIGIINAVPVLLTLITGVLIGRLSDRASDWKTAIVVLAAIAGVAPFGLLATGEFWGILIVTALATYPASALVPIIDAATLRMTDRRGTDFNLVRAWGTVGYLVASALTGIVIGSLGGGAFIPMFIAFALLRTATAIPLPRFRAPEEASVKVSKTISAGLGELLRPWFLLPCIAFALIQATHVFLSTMGALVWKIEGIGEGWFGPLIAASAAAEAVTMFAWRYFHAKMSARTMLIIAGLVGAGRWVAMGLDPSLPMLFALQALHAITFPFAYFGIMHFIANWAPERIAAEAQSFSMALTMAVTVVTLVALGWLVGVAGGQAYFAAAAMAFGCAIAAWLSLRLRPAHAPTAPAER
jgi:MFS transporter, PPP family, 3-phenylpropionic acid transporter